MTDTRLSPSALSALDEATFTDYLAGIYEHSPWIPQRTWPRRPFASRDDLAVALAQTLDGASETEKRGLILAHPELAGKAAAQGDLTDDSKREQQGAGLNQCSPEELARIQSLNQAYGQKFGFPFIIAVKGLDRQAIIAAMERRLGHTLAEETLEALAQIKRIAGFRLADKVED